MNKIKYCLINLTWYIFGDCDRIYNKLRFGKCTLKK